MNYDENMLCPVCKAKLFTDEVAVCPDCGAPHHKKCFLGLGHCFYADKHGTDEQWTMPKIPHIEEKSEPQSSIEKCNVCGYPIGESDFTCKKCGAPKGYTTNNSANSRYTRTAENPFFAANGIDKDEIIDGERTEDIAKYVGYNALRYIKIFRKMFYNKTKVSWNWVAFFFPEYWLISRKCYVPAILMGFFSLLNSLFSGIAMTNPIMQSFMNNISEGNLSVYNGVLPVEIVNITTVLFVLSIIAFVLKLIFGIFGDYIYKKRVYSGLKEMKANRNMSEIAFIKNGGVNLMLPIILYFALNMLTYIISVIV